MAKRLDLLLDTWEPILRDAFLAAIYKVRSDAHFAQIVAQIEAGNIDGAVRAVGLDPAQFRPLDLATAQAFEAAGNATAALIPKTALDGDGFRLQFNFNVRARSAEEWLSRRAANNVTQIISDQREMIRDFLTDGLSRGVNPRTSALDLVGRVSATTGQREGGMIGLTTSQMEWVSNYREELESNSASALTRALRDARYDAAIEKALENGEPLSSSQIDTMVQNYSNRALRYRGEAIARTETMAALHEGQQEATEQMIASKKVDASDVVGIWHATLDDRTRESHAEMEGQERAMGDMFETGDGNFLEYPGDPDGEPAEIINCRCWREISIDFLAGVD